MCVYKVALKLSVYVLSVLLVLGGAEASRPEHDGLGYNMARALGYTLSLTLKVVARTRSCDSSMLAWRNDVLDAVSS